MYATSTTGDNKAGRAYLSTLPYKRSTENCNFFFYYYMDGNSDSSIIVYVKTAEGRMKKLYETSHSQQDTWQLSDTIQIGEYYNFAIIMQAKTASGGSDRYIAVDDVNFANQCGYGAGVDVKCGPDDFQCDSGHCIKNYQVCDKRTDCPDGADELEGVCTSLPGDCSFDDSQAIASCSWQQLSDDDFDWSVGSSTPTSGTGPTGPREGPGNFLFIEATARQQGDLARVASPSFPASSGKCVMRFFYHLLGLSMGTLRVYVKDSISSQMTPMWSAESNQGNEWKYAAVELTSANDYTVVFEGSVGNGELSDMAIDDISFTYDCAVPGGPRPTDPPGPKCNITNGVFCPGDRVCISQYWMCDGVLDCPLDFFDEPGNDMCQNITLPTKLPQTSDDGVIIAIIVVACILVLILLLLVTYLYAKKRQQQKRFGDIATSHSGQGGLDNPVYGTETYGDTPLHDFTMSEVDTSMFDADAAEKEKPKAAKTFDPSLPMDNDTQPIVKHDSLA